MPNASIPEPTWIEIIPPLIQAAIGACSALIAVFLANKFAQRDRKIRLFDRIFEPYFNSHSQIYSCLLNLHDALMKLNLSNLSEIDDSVKQLKISIKRNLLWLDEHVASLAIEICSSIDSDSGAFQENHELIKSRILETQRSIRQVLGVPDFQLLMEEFRSNIRRK